MKFSYNKDNVRWVGLKQLKEIKAQASVPKTGGEAKFSPVPMFLPTDTKGLTVANVVTRHNFINQNISTWVRWKTSRIGAIVCAILAIVFLAYSVVIAAVFGAAAGFLTATHIWDTFYIKNLLGKRYLLEST